MRQTSRIPAIICLAALLLFGVAANVHTHAWGSIDPTDGHHCTACDLYYSGVGQARVSPVCVLNVEIASLPVPRESACMVPHADIAHEPSRAPPSA